MPLPRLMAYSLAVLMTTSIVAPPSKFVRQPVAVPDEYIVVLQESTQPRAFDGIVEGIARGYKWDTEFSAYADAVSELVAGKNILFFTSADNWSGDACQFAPNNRAYTNTNTSGRGLKFLESRSAAGTFPLILITSSYVSSTQCIDRSTGAGV